MKEARSRLWQKVGEIDSSKREFKVETLFEGQQYNFRVAAENEVGAGEYAELFQMVTAKSQYGEY